MNKLWICLILGLALISFLAIVQSPDFTWEGTSGTVAWVNSTGSLNISEDFECSDCINTEDVDDLDVADIEGDGNTFVDIGGDTMTANLGMGDVANVTGIPMINMTGGICIKSNITHIIMESC